jgi:hypothetical protein
MNTRLARLVGFIFFVLSVIACAPSHSISPTHDAPDDVLVTHQGSGSGGGSSCACGIGFTTFSNADYTALTTDVTVAQVGALTAARAVRLPSAASCVPGQDIEVGDWSGTATPWYAIDVRPNGTDTIDGRAAQFPLVWASETAKFRTDGVSAWQVVGRSHPRALYAEVAPSVFVFDDDLFASGVTFGSANSTVAPYGQAVFPNLGHGQVQAGFSYFGELLAFTGITGSSSDTAYIRNLSTVQLLFGLGLMQAEIIITDRATPNGTDDFTIVAGFMGGTTSGKAAFAANYPQWGCFFFFDRSVSTTDWQAACISNGNGTLSSNATVVDTGLTINALSYLGIQVAADASSTTFFGNGAIVATITTDVPMATSPSTGPQLGLGVGYWKKAGTESSTIIVGEDRVRLRYASAATRAN